jgi:hypothetical protein
MAFGILLSAAWQVAASKLCLMGCITRHLQRADIASCFLPQGVLSKLSASKELMKEILAREQKKQAEREADKAARAAKVAAEVTA